MWLCARGRRRKGGGIISPCVYFQLNLVSRGKIDGRYCALATIYLIYLESGSRVEKAVIIMKKDRGGAQVPGCACYLIDIVRSLV